MRAKRAISLLLVVSVLLSSNPALGQENGSVFGDDNTLTGTGGTTMVIRAATASWCDICKEVDPVVVRIAESGGSTVTRIAMHPNDGIDPIGSRFSTQQVWALGGDPTTLEYPTHWIGGNAAVVGAFDDNSYHRERIKHQMAIDPTESLYMHASMLENDTIAIEVSGNEMSDDWIGTLSFYITEDGVDVGEAALDLKGVRYHDDVLRAGVVVNLETQEIQFQDPDDGWALEFAPDQVRVLVDRDDQWKLGDMEFTVLHEDGEGNYLSAITLPEQNPDYQNSDSAALILFAILGGGCILATPYLGVKKVRHEDADADSEE